MPQHSLRTILSAALLAGLLAGLVVGIFHLIATEPVLQRAIDIEELHRQAAGTPAEPGIVSRSAQHIGLIAGFLLYGVTWGAMFGLVYWCLAGRASGGRTLRHGLGLALVGYWTLGIFPQLKYPANPPGVGEAATIGYRQSLYFTFLGLSVLGAVLAALVYRDLGRLGRAWHRPWVRVPLVAILYALYATAAGVLLPDHSDPVLMPPALVTQFRWLSVAGITVFWLMLGGTFVLLEGRRAGQAASRA